MKGKLIRWGVIIAVAGIVIGGGTAFYMFNQPHRDVQAITADFQMESSALVSEYLNDQNAANNKYLSEEGDSKIIAISGTVAAIDTDMKDQKVILLKDADQDAGVSCTFMASTNENANKLNVGDKVTIKGVIRSGAGYDEDLELYEDVIMEKCDIVA